MQIFDTLFLRAADGSVWQIVINPDGSLSAVAAGALTL